MSEYSQVGPRMPRASSNVVPRGNWLISLSLNGKEQALIHFSRNVGTMLQAGLSLEQVLHRQRQYASNGALRTALVQMHQDVSRGMTLSDTLAKHPKLFNEFYRNVIRVGEESGQLDVAFREAAEVQERFLALRRKVVSVLMYPGFVIGVALFDVILFLSVIIPYLLKFVEQTLGKPMGLLVLVSGIAHYWWILFILVGVALTGVACFCKTALGREILDEFVLYVPLLNETVQVAESSYFLMGLGLGYQSGLTLEHAARLAVDAISNQSVKAMFAGLAERLQSGAALSEALAEVGYLPGTVLEMVDSGEVSGTLQNMLDTASDYLEQEMNARMELFMALLKPLLLLTVALMIGSALLMIYMAVFATVGGILNQAIRH